MIYEIIIRYTKSEDYDPDLLSHHAIREYYLFNNNLKSINWKNLHNWFHFTANFVASFFG